MKTKTYTLLFLLISASVLQANSQTAMMSSGDPIEQKVTHLKSFESRYFEGKVYLHITVNGNTETKTVAVERSLDATHFEMAGYIIIYGTTVQTNLAYYFNEEPPVFTKLYYRLADYTYYNSPVYSETINVITTDENKAVSVITSNILSSINK